MNHTERSALRSLRRVLAPLALAWLCALTPAVADETWRLEHEGLAIELSIEPAVSARGALREGESAVFRFAITDMASGQPLGGLYPAAWMARLSDGETAGASGCLRKVEEFVGGSILAQPELDLNVYYVVAMNDDATLSVVDPLFGFGGTKLLAQIHLPSPGEDWALSADRRRLFVSAREADRLAVADTVTWKHVTDLEVGPRPMRVALQGDGAYVWVAVTGGVVAVDARTLEIVGRIDTGQGPHDIAFSDDHRFTFVTNRRSDTVSVIDVRRLRKVRDLATGRGPASVDYSALAAAAYVSHAGDGTIVALDADGVRGEMQAEPGLGQIRAAPGGRLVFAVNPEKDTVSIVDTAKNRIVQTGDLKDEPFQIAFSTELAYIAHRGSETVLMIPLDEVGTEGRRVPVVDFPGGEQPLGAGTRSSLAPAMVQAPGANAMLVANPADEVIYFYREGMAAPMGGFRNYRRQPRAVLVVDRSLRERTRPGLYETAAKLRRPGRYQVAFYLDTPRIIHCFETEVLPNAEFEQQRRAQVPARVEALSAPRQDAEDGRVEVRFRLLDPHSGEPLPDAADVVVMAYAPGNWQRRMAAVHQGDGVYAAIFEPPGAGAYTLAVECRSCMLRFHQSPQMPLAVAMPAGD